MVSLTTVKTDRKQIDRCVGSLRKVQGHQASKRDMNQMEQRITKRPMQDASTNRELRDGRDQCEDGRSDCHKHGKGSRVTSCELAVGERVEVSAQKLFETLRQGDDPSGMADCSKAIVSPPTRLDFPYLMDLSIAPRRGMTRMTGDSEPVTVQSQEGTSWRNSQGYLSW